jgi:TRAP transporter TAXI family solute receptor
MATYRFQEKKHRTALWTALILLTVGMLVLSIWLNGPSPPQKIIWATGTPNGAYAAFGKKYQKQLHRMGLEVELVNTNGSIDNLQRVASGEVDVAFAQGGTYQLVEDPDRVVRGLVAIYLEPLWVFYRGSEPVRSISDFKGRTISVGPSESGTDAIGRLLLKKHGIDGRNATILNMPVAVARERLEKGTLAVGLFVSSYADPTIQALLRRKDLTLMNFKRHDVAHARQFPYLKSVTLPEGLLDLKENIPREEETLLAPAAILVCREGLHPRVVEQIIKAAYTIQSPGSLIDAPNRFPTLEGVGIQVHETAETYMKSGESFLTRVLPYWGVRLVLQLRILILPLLAIWIPFLKILPWIYNMRVNSLLKRHYAALRELESAIAQANNAGDLRERLTALEHLRSDMEALSKKVPGGLQRDVYHWRLHVALVHTEAVDRLKRMEAGKPEQDHPVVAPVEMVHRG